VNPQLVSLIELALNVTLAAIPATTAFAPLAAGIEAAANPLVASIATGATKTTDVLAGFATVIAVITALKQQTGIAPAVLAKLDEYLVAAQNGTVAALTAHTAGYDASQLAPVTPIA
jgi:hypothetical protein